MFPKNRSQDIYPSSIRLSGSMVNDDKQNVTEIVQPLHKVPFSYYI